jgi:hypothetical protein
VSVPKQVPSGHAAYLWQVKYSSEKAITGGVPGMILLNLLIGSNLSAIWTALNILLFLYFIRFWRISPPSNLKVFIEEAAYFARWDFIPKKKLLEMINFRNEAESDQGVQLKLYLLIAGALVGIAALAAVFAYVLRKLKPNTSVEKACSSVVQNVFWNGVIRFGIQTYLDLAVVSLLLTTLFNQGDPVFGSQMEPSSRLLTGFAAAALFATIPILLFRFLWTRFRWLDDQASRYGTLWSGLKSNHFDAVIYHVVFMVRRYLFALISVFAGSYDGGLALLLNVSLSIVYCLYVTHTRPHDSTKYYRLELTIETLLLFSFYGFLACEIEPNPKTKYRFGWWSVACISVLILIMYVNMVYEGVYSLIRFIRRKAYRPRAKATEPAKKVELSSESEVESEYEDERPIDEEQPKLLELKKDLLLPVIEGSPAVKKEIIEIDDALDFGAIEEEE